MKIVSFLKTNKPIKHIVLIVVFTIALLWITLQILNLYTLHGKSVTVPDFSGLTIKELDEFASERNLSYEIVDSVYDSDKEKGTVFTQEPPPNTKVKKNRKIYLTVVAMLPERISMPDLTDLSLRQAIALLETYGLKVGTLEYIPDPAKNAVLKQKYKGKEITSGTMIEKGSTINLVLGEGLRNEKVQVPFLYGKTREEAINILNAVSLNAGAEVFEDVEDSAKARVYKQKPVFSKNIFLYLGESVDLWYKSDDKFDFKSLLEKHINDTITQ